MGAPVRYVRREGGASVASRRPTDPSEQGSDRIVVPKRNLVAIALLALLASACQFGRPEPAVPDPHRGAPHRTLLMVGDSLVGQHDVAFPTVLAQHGIDATVVDAHVNGSGLFGPVGDAGSALQWVQEKVAEHPEADPVVIEWTGVCAVCGTTVGGVAYPAIGDAAGGFYSLWVSKALEIVDWLRAQGKTVVWVTSPPMGVDTPSIHADASRLLSMLDALVIGPSASTAAVNWFDALSDTDGNYAPALWYDGQFNTVRTVDLIPLTMAGATRAATWTVAGLADLLASMPPPSPSSASTPTGLVEAGDPVRLDVGGTG